VGEAYVLTGIFHQPDFMGELGSMALDEEAPKNRRGMLCGSKRDSIICDVLSGDFHYSRSTSVCVGIFIAPGSVDSLDFNIHRRGGLILQKAHPIRCGNRLSTPIKGETQEAAQATQGLPLTLSAPD